MPGDRLMPSDTTQTGHEGNGQGTPPLHNGDHLDRIEFERRYDAMPHVKKAELIEGVVYMPSPVSHRRHGRQHSVVHWWLNEYTEATPGVEPSDAAWARLALDNDPQPDAVLMILPDYGGAVHFEDEY